jgi:PilZ domain
MATWPPGEPGHDRRTVARYPLIATVEILESSSQMRFSGRISEISRKGCYVDVLNPLPVGTAIELRITRDTGTFVTSGKIIYADQGMGMGAAFSDTPADQLKILDAWIAELAS